MLIHWLPVKVMDFLKKKGFVMRLEKLNLIGLLKRMDLRKRKVKLMVIRKSLDLPMQMVRLMG